MGHSEWRRSFAKAGRQVNRKRVQRLMRLMGLEAADPKPKTSRPSAQHLIYPHLLRGLLPSAVSRAIRSRQTCFCGLSRSPDDRIQRDPISGFDGDGCPLVHRVWSHKTAPRGITYGSLLSG
jgi:hypothetical protein